jgi:hypothetical protein
MTFLEAVNLILRTNTFIAGDDDDITSFSDTQHRATMNLAQIAIKSTLNELVSDRLLPYEELDGHITTASNTRTYSMPDDFVRFVGENPILLKLSGVAGSDAESVFITEYPGGEEAIRRQILNYREQTGTPQWFYMVNGTSKKLGFYPVPEEVATYRFPYQKDVSVSIESDDLPFHTTQEATAFVDMAARYMKFLIEKLPVAQLYQDPVFVTSKSALMSLIKPIRPKGAYGFRYGHD